MKLSVLNSAMLILLTTAASAPAWANSRDIPPGLWEIKSKMDIPGMPPGMAEKMGKTTLTQCIKAGERKWNEQPAAKRPGEPKCDPVETKADGNKMTWKVRCADGSSGEGVVTHNGRDSYKMNMTMKSPQGSMKMETEGRRIAETCDKPKAKTK